LECGGRFRVKLEGFLGIGGSKESEFNRALKLETLNCRFNWRGLRGGEQEIVDFGAGELGFPAVFKNESSSSFNW